MLSNALKIRHGKRYRDATPSEVLTAAAALVVAESRGAAVDSPRDAAQLCRSLCAGYDNEHFGVVWLDTRHRILHAETLFTGTIDGATVYPRVVVKRALELNAAAVILTHNHPSGIAEPSEADRSITLKLSKALALVEIRLLDHLIVTSDACVSLAERGVGMTNSAQRSDFSVEHHLTIALVRPESDEARAWCAERLATDDALTWGRAYVVEPRYLDDILRAIVQDRLSVQLHG